MNFKDIQKRIQKSYWLHPWTIRIRHNATTFKGINSLETFEKKKHMNKLKHTLERSQNWTIRTLLMNYRLTQWANMSLMQFPKDANWLATTVKTGQYKNQNRQLKHEKSKLKIPKAMMEKTTVEPKNLTPTTKKKQQKWLKAKNCPPTLWLMLESIYATEKCYLGAKQVKRTLCWNMKPAGPSQLWNQRSEANAFLE